MIWYVAFVALLNLGLGYALAHFLGAGEAQTALAGGDESEYVEYSDSYSDSDVEEYSAT